MSRRNSYLGNKPTDVMYDLPGMAELAKRDHRGKVAFAQKTERRNAKTDTVSKTLRGARDTYIPTRTLVDAQYNVPGMTDAILRDRRPSAAFAPTYHRSDRDTYIRAVPKPVDANYDPPKTATPRSPALHGSPSRDSYVKAVPLPVDAFYDVPDMATLSLRRSRGSPNPKGAKPESRDSHIRALHGRFLDKQYDVPGMAESLHRDPRGRAAFAPDSPRKLRT
jgi:hypothetical protein